MSKASNRFKIREDGSVNFRINGLVTNSKFFIEPFEKKDENTGIVRKSYFGDFTILSENVSSIVKDFENLIDVLEVPDTIFGGQYPVVVEDGDYGWKIKIMGKPRFYEALNGREITGEEIYDYVYDLEVRVSMRKDGTGVYVNIPRAFKAGVRERQFTDDDLFADHDVDYEDDLPF